MLLIIERNGSHFEGDKVYYIDGRITFQELAELIIYLYRNEDKRKIKYPDKINFMGHHKLKYFLEEATSEGIIPIRDEILSKYDLI